MLVFKFNPSCIWLLERSVTQTWFDTIKFFRIFNLFGILSEQKFIELIFQLNLMNVYICSGNQLKSIVETTFLPLPSLKVINLFSLVRRIINIIYYCELFVLVRRVNCELRKDGIKFVLIKMGFEKSVFRIRIRIRKRWYGSG